MRLERTLWHDVDGRGQFASALLVEGDAEERLRELAGDVVPLENGPRITDAYGRTLAYVYTEDGASIDAALIAEGLATA